MSESKARSKAAKQTPYAKLAKRLFKEARLKGLTQEERRRRFSLVQGIVRDALRGSISIETAKRLIREGTARPGLLIRLVRGRDHSLWRDEFRLRQFGRTRRF